MKWFVQGLKTQGLITRFRGVQWHGWAFEKALPSRRLTTITAATETGSEPGESESIQNSARARSLLKTNRALLDRFLDSRDELHALRPAFGTVAFPRLLRGSVETLCGLLREQIETMVVRGRFFEIREHFRMGIWGRHRNARRRPGTTGRGPGDGFESVVTDQAQQFVDLAGEGAVRVRQTAKIDFHRLS